MFQRRLGLALAALILTTGAAFADPIEGLWRTEVGSTARVVPRSAGFCITLINGQHAGARIGTLAAKKPGRYEGTVTDPADNKTYSGKATVTGNTLKLTGCALAIFCKSQIWSRL